MHNTKDCCWYDRGGKEKADFHATKKGRKKPNPARQNFAQLSKKLDKLEKTLKKASKKSKKCQYEDSNSNSEWGVGLSSTRKVEFNLGETIKKMKVTPLSPIKATPTNIASNPDDV
jgi:hypothetical protein